MHDLTYIMGTRLLAFLMSEGRATERKFKIQNFLNECKKKKKVCKAFYRYYVKITPGGRWYHYHHFADEETETD